MWTTGDPPHVIWLWSCMRARSAAAALEGHPLVLFKIHSMLCGPQAKTPYCSCVVRRSVAGAQPFMHVSESGVSGPVQD